MSATNQSSRRALVATVVSVVVLVAVAGAFGIVLSQGNPTSSAPPTSTSRVTCPTTPGSSNTANVDNPNGLELRFGVSSLTVKSGQPLVMCIDEYNTLDKFNSVTAENNWKFFDLAIGPCGHTAGDYQSEAGFSLFRGNLSASELTSTDEVDIYTPSPPEMCPQHILLISGYLFQPKSDLETYILSYSTTPMYGHMSFTVKVTSEYTGTWPNIENVALPPGEYTVAAGDEWGSLVVLHVLITS